MLCCLLAQQALAPAACLSPSSLGTRLSVSLSVRVFLCSGVRRAWPRAFWAESERSRVQRGDLGPEITGPGPGGAAGFVAVEAASPSGCCVKDPPGRRLLTVGCLRGRGERQGASQAATSEYDPSGSAPRALISQDPALQQLWVPRAGGRRWRWPRRC